VVPARLLIACKDTRRSIWRSGVALRCRKSGA